MEVLCLWRGAVRVARVGGERPLLGHRPISTAHWCSQSLRHAVPLAQRVLAAAAAYTRSHRSFQSFQLLYQR